MFCTGDEATGKKDFKMMCVRGYSSDIADAINLDEKLETSSKLPPNNGQFEKSFAGMYVKVYFVIILLHLAHRHLILHLHFWNNWLTQTCHRKTQQVIYNCICM